ncbi:DUF835 domain-containing protein [Thermococcus indicus]|uniref:DUF835 domain-containing protein n=1 Tax=Thermococcus indicus TaxID=2586643 RepID=A0A4Y5SLR3_9EURY|nr:DUF835 domain-containing protein [Thermococcus indicus]QDA31725.1 DUF835 domain-containing protein [Thermococcus indicus]
MKPELKKYLETVVNALRDKNPREILSYAIFNELEEVEYYRKLAERARRESIRVLFIQMADESVEHYETLMSLFRKLYPGEEPVKVEAPPVEVAPFYPEFETVDDYLAALEYCMESELFAKETYEILAQKALNEDSRALFAQLALMEEGHYQRLKKAYELLAGFTSRNQVPEDLRPGGYLFSDEVKARYVFLDLLSKGKRAMVISREHPEKLKEWFKSGDMDIIWLSSAPVKNALTPNTFVSSKPALYEVLQEGNVLMLVEDCEYIALHVGFTELMKTLSTLRDVAMTAGSYLLIQANPDAFERKEWALLTSELMEVS